MMLNNPLKAVLGIATLPVDAVADAITMGGAMTDKRRPYTADKAIDIMKNIKEATR